MISIGCSWYPHNSQVFSQVNHNDFDSCSRVSRQVDEITVMLIIVVSVDPNVAIKID